jgi:hypothetical protein
MAAVLAAGLASFRDYGVSWDERVQRKYGQEIHAYVAEGDRELFTDRHRYYGPVFEITLNAIERAAGLEDTRSVYLMRHLVTFLVFWVGVGFFYLLCSRCFRSWKLGLLGAAFLVVSPRIFAHAFFNSKDVPFMAVFIVGVYTLLRFLDARNTRWALIHGAVCAVLVDIRIIGILLVVLTVLMTANQARLAGLRGSLRGLVPALAAYLAILAGLVVAMWPTLWHDPARNFIRVFEGMRNFPWEATVLYAGSYVWSTSLPWHYIPVWIVISIPLSLVLMAGAGLAAAARSLAGKGGGLGSREAFIVLFWLLVPIGYSIASDAVLYDAWRHAFFVFPALIVMGLAGLSLVLKLIESRAKGAARRIAQAAVLVAIAVNLAAAGAFMIRNHPHQNVYFNSLVGGIRGAEGRFELDYWGLSCRRGLELILRNSQAPRITVNAATPPGRYNADILKPEDRSRLVFVSEPRDAAYYITNFRWQKADELPSPIYAVTVDGVAIAAVYRIWE